MSEMKERIARALCLRYYAGNEDDIPPLGSPPEVRKHAWEMFLDGADVVLETMREPTDAMLLSTRIAKGLRQPADIEAIKVGNKEDWQDMTDAALSKPLSSPISYTMEAETGRFENEGSALK
jgi:hypothetical protein